MSKLLKGVLSDQAVLLWSAYLIAAVVVAMALSSIFARQERMLRNQRQIEGEIRQTEEMIERMVDQR